MSALAWLFGLGALTIAFPILFHMIRRTPKGQMQFSSLMFLKPSPPTLTRRSRLENLLLLFLRALAIGLIAFAFMRPFFRSADSLSNIEVANRRVAILLDDSASMRRAGVWDDAKKQVNAVLGELEAGDDVSLLTFSENLNQVVAFSESSEASGSDRAGLIREELKSLEPTWGRSDIGQAVVKVADLLDVWRDTMKEKLDGKLAKLQIIVVSDMQEGSKLDALQSYQWPASVYVKFLPVASKNKSNATVQLLNPSEDDKKGTLRIRVANAGESQSETFAVTWNGAASEVENDAIDFYVPGGTSRVLKVEPEQLVSANKFELKGDSEDFDNSFFLVPAQQQKMEVAYFGSDIAGDPEQPQLYLQSALMETPTRVSTLRQVGANDSLIDGQRATMAVVTSALSSEQKKEVDDYLKSGGTVFVALSGREIAENTSEWTGANPVDLENEDDRDEDDYLMLADIKFSHPIFKPFAKSGYNDFTAIRFWKRQPVEFENDDVEVLATFDDDTPAIWQRTVGKGTVFAIASGWQPSQSQLALSPKFVPLVNRMIEVAADLPELTKSLLVNEPIDLSLLDGLMKSSGQSRASTKVVMVKPNGMKVPVASDETRFLQTDSPGIYSLRLGRENDRQNSGQSGSQDSKAIEAVSFAVNVDRAESGTEAIPVSQIEMLGVKVGEQQAASSELMQMRDMKDREIESQQQVWKWLIVAAMVLLIGETWLAGQTTSKMIAGTA